MKIKYCFLICSSLLLIACSTIITEATNWIEQSNTNNTTAIEGNYFLIENGLIKTFLPQGFNRYSLEQYKEILDSTLTKKQVHKEMKRLEAMREMKGSLHLFFDPNTLSTYSINTLPFMNFSKSDATVLLSMIKRNNNKVSLSTDLNFKKQTATYTKNSNFTMFRSIFQVDNFKADMTIFSTFYIISANKQTFMINLTTPFEVNFDRYIEKMKF